MTTSNTTYTFYTSRTAARAAVTTGVKFKDHGADAPTGERWSTYSLVESAPTLKTAVVKEKATRTPRENSKKSLAVTLITRLMAEGKERKEILAELVAKCDLTAPGASTYYANVKKGTWAA